MADAHEDETNLDALMARLADGDRSAFDPIFRAFHPRALRLARLRLEEADALDAAQSALEKVFSRAGEYTPGRPVLPWFYAVAANEIHAVARRARTARARTDGDGALPDDLAATADDPERQLARAELEAAVADAIKGLDPVSASAIAAMLGDAAPLAPKERKRVSRAYARLRHLLERFQ